MRLDWIPDILRDAGLDIVVMEGAATRGRQLTAVHGIVWHSTVTGANWTDQRVAALLRDGHANLPGPLAHLGPSRSGKIYIPALGRCNHNGYGLWGNDSISIEFFNDGYARFAGWQMEAGVIATAAMLRYLGRGVDAVKGHKETDPPRKIDPPEDMNVVRLRVSAELNNQKEIFTVGQYEDIMAAIKAADLHAIDAANRAQAAQQAIAEVAERQVPEETVRQAIRDLRRIGLKVGAEIEGPNPDRS